MIEKIVLDKKQTKAIAQTIYSDVKSYCLDNFERYFPWLLNERCKAKSLPSLKISNNQNEPCSFCYNCNDPVDMWRTDYEENR